MGIIRAAVSAVGGTVSDQWLEVVEPRNLSNTTIMAKGTIITKGGAPKPSGVITDGSVIKVGENQLMLLVDGGKIIDYSAEPGYFTVDNKNAPSLLNGDFGGALSDAYNRFKFGGITPFTQQVYYINTQEIQNVPFGTANPINYFDEFYNAELYVRAHGYYSLRVINPLKFYSEMASHNSDYIGIDELRKLCLSEFLTAFQAAIGKMSVEGVRISHITSRSMDLAKHMSTILDESWEEKRGMRIESVGISSVSYDEQSKKLIDIRNQGAMLGDSNIRTGYVQGATARGLEAAGSNSSGATNAFMGVNMGMNSAGTYVAATNEANRQPTPQAPAAPTGDSWVCGNCNYNNTSGKFCSNCGAQRAAAVCPNCKMPIADGSKFCNNCGAKL